MNEGILVIEENNFIRESALEELSKVFSVNKGVKNCSDAIPELNSSKYNNIICHFENEFNEAFLNKLYSKFQDIKVFLLISTKIDNYLQQIIKFPQIKNFIALRPTLPKKELLTTLLLVIKGEKFGVKKYLSKTREIQFNINDSKQKEGIIEKALSFLSKTKVSSRIERVVADVVDELVMNIIYNAPVDYKGEKLYRHLKRNEQVLLNQFQQGTIKMYCCEDFVGLSASDPFGKLDLKTVLNYLNDCYATKGRISEDSGGAGLGMYQIYRHSSHLIINVIPENLTEVIVLIDISLKDRLRNKYPKSIHFFEKKDKSDLITLEQLLKYCQLTDIKESRKIEENYVELVFEQNHLDTWKESLSKFLGPPNKEPKAEPTAEQIEISKEFGGIREEQTLFCNKQNSNNLIAMIWPWKSNDCFTLKIGTL